MQTAATIIAGIGGGLLGSSVVFLGTGVFYQEPFGIKLGLGCIALSVPVLCLLFLF